MRTHNKHVLMCIGPRCSGNNEHDCMDAGGTTPRMEEVEQCMEQLPRATQGAVAEAMFQQLGEKIDARPVGAEIRSASLVILMRFTAFSTYDTVCKNGPTLVVYPEGVWYSCTDEAILERIVSEHLENNSEVSEHVSHRLGAGDA